MRPSRFATPLLALGIVFFSGVRLRAQATEDEVRTRLLNQPLFFRGGWVEDKLKFDAAGQPGKAYGTGPPTVCGFRADEVQVSGDHLRLTGVRVGIVFDPSGDPHRQVIRAPHQPSSADEKVTVDIDRQGQPDFKAALDAVFTDNLRDVPRIELSSPGTYLPVCPASQPPGAPAAPSAPSAPPCWPRPAQPAKSIRAPQLLKSADPDFSEWARRSKISGTVNLHLYVDRQGLPARVQVVKRVGMGLDEQAIAAVNRYRFRPATQDGQPVPVDLYVDVHFQIF